MADCKIAPALPDIQLEVLEEMDADTPGFLALRRTRMRARYSNGDLSEPFLYDSVTRRCLDAVAIAAHHLVGDVPHVYLRSALRAPVITRDSARSAVRETGVPSLWELPAGLVEPDEEGSLEGVTRSAQRELLEELGFDVPLRELRPLGPSSFPVPGMIAERHYFFEVRVDPAEQQVPCLDGSPLEREGVVVSVPLIRALDMCRRGDIEDEKTELGLRRLMELLE